MRKRGGGLGFIPWLLSSIVSTFAIVKLIQAGNFAHDFHPVIESWIDAYSHYIGIAFDPLQEWIEPRLRRLAGMFGWHIDLQDHWRHVFLLSMVLFLALARVLGWRGNLQSALLFAGFGLLGALAGALIASSAPLGGDARSEMVIFAAPLGALCIALGLAAATDSVLGGRRGGAFVSPAVFLGAGTSFAFAATRWTLPFYDDLIALGVASPGLALLGPAVILIALLYIVRGAIFALGERGTGRSALVRVRNDASVQVGFVMLGGFIGTALLFAASAWLKLAE